MKIHNTGYAIQDATRAIFKIAALGALYLLFSPAWQPALAQDKPAAQTKEQPVCKPDDPTQVRLQIDVTGMRSTAGNITITIYPDEPSHFLDGKYKLARQQLTVTSPVTHACFAMAGPGAYAVALFHDKNGNHHFDTNFLGIPTEAYGFSNNPTLYVGPPKLKQVRIIAHPGDNKIAVQLKHY